MHVRLLIRPCGNAAPGRLAALAALAITGCDGTSTVEFADVDLAHSFHVTLHMQYDDPSPVWALAPESLVFWLRIDDSPDGSRAIAGPLENMRGALDGPVQAVGFERQDSGKRALLAPFEVLGSRPDDVLHTDWPLCAQPAYSLQFDTLWLSPVDSDGDGAIDGVSGSASGALTAGFKDFVHAGPFAATVAGALDTRAPYLFVMGAAPDRVYTVVEPLDILASEPLPLNVQARLVASTGEIIDMELERRPATAPAFTALHVTPEAWLAFDTRYRIEVAPGPGLVDMAGNSNRSPGVSFRTAPDPGLFAEDGFEGPVAMTTAGDIRVVSGLGSMPAISGASSLVLGMDSRVALRVPVNPGDSHLRMDARALSSGATTLRAEVRVYGASPGDIVVSSLGEPFTGVDYTPINDRIWTHASTLRSIEVALPATTDGEVMVVIDVSSDPCHDSSQGLGLFIDDVRVE